MIYQAILLALAIARIAILFVADEGPYMIFLRLRSATGITYDEYSNRVVVQKNPHLRVLAGILNCTNCASLWIALVFSLFYRISPKRAIAVAWPFALSMLGMIFVRISDG